MGAFSESLRDRSEAPRTNLPLEEAVFRTWGDSGALLFIHVAEISRTLTIGCKHVLAENLP